MMTAHKFRIAMIISVLLAAGECRAKEVTVTIKSEPETYTLTFDDTVISEAQVRALLPISPHPLSSDISQAPSLELCIDGDPRYSPCGSRDLHDPNFFRNAQVNLDIAKNHLTGLETLNYPQELTPVVEYEELRLTFTLWLEQTKYEFYRSWDTGILKRKFQDLDPLTLCPLAILRIQNAQSKDERYHLVWYEWHNCLNEAFFKRFGEYPKDAWERFLEAYGIKEKFEVDVD